ncbi:MAG: IS200/IS605 family transposase [Bacteroidia bacterium]
MANTYTQLYYHIVFAVKGRGILISVQWKDELYKFINCIITNNNQKLIIINGVPDHVHLLLGLKPDIKLSDIIRDIKSNSTRFINERNFVKGKFEWQIGFGAFTIGTTQLDGVINYIKNQEIHHRKKSFREEYIEFLEDSNIEYKSDYIFEEFN